MNTGEIVLWILGAVIFSVCIYGLLFTGPFGFNVDIQQRKLKHNKQKNKTSIEVYSDAKDNM